MKRTQRSSAQRAHRPTNAKEVTDTDLATLRRVYETPGAIPLLGIYINLPADCRTQLLVAAKKKMEQALRRNGKAISKTLRRPKIYPVGEQSGYTSEYALRPTEIQVKGGFGKFEIEQRAQRIVEFFKEQGAWVGFTMEQLAAFIGKNYGAGAAKSMFVGLHGPSLSIVGILPVMGQSHENFVTLPDGTMYVTNKFIDRCAGIWPD